MKIDKSLCDLEKIAAKNYMQVGMAMEAIDATADDDVEELSMHSSNQFHQMRRYYKSDRKRILQETWKLCPKANSGQEFIARFVDMGSEDGYMLQSAFSIFTQENAKNGQGGGGRNAC